MCLNAINEIHGVPQTRPFVSVAIHRQNIAALIDSGASVSAINHNVMNNLIRQYGHTAFPAAKTSMVITNANGKSMEPSEIRRIPLLLPGNQRTFVDVHVVKDLSCPLILGMNFLRQNNVTIDCATNKVRFTHGDLNAMQSNTLPPQASPDSVVPLIAKETVTLQPFALATTSAALAQGDTTIDYNGAGVVVGKDSDILNGIVEVKNNETAAIKLINTTYEPRYVHKGDTVGYLTKLNLASKYIEIARGAQGPEGRMTPDAFNHLQQITEHNAALQAKQKAPWKISKIRPSPGSARPPQLAVINPTMYPKLRKSGKISEKPMTKMEFLKKNLRVKAPTEYQKLYWQLIDEFQDVFSENDTDLGLTPTVKHTIKMDTEQPVHVKQFTIPFAQQPFIKQKVKDLLVQGIIERSTSKYNTPIFAIPKKPVPGQPQGYRLIQDLRRINDHTMLDKFTLQDIKECIDKVGTRNASVFSSLDLTAGFFQIELDVNSRQFTAFTIPGDGQYQWTRVCLGLHGAPSTFAKLMSIVMQDLQQAMVYLDDVLCASKDHVSHITDLRQCLLRLRKHKLKLNPFKTELGAETVQYLGYTISRHGITTSDNKHEAIRDFPAPTSRKQIRQFVGLANFYRQLIPGFHKIAGILTGLTKTLSSYRGGPLPANAHAAFIKLKQRLCAKPVIAFPNPNLPFSLATDASSGDANTSGGLGAVLTQKVNGKTHTIAYASRALKDNEKNYSAFLLEKLAITWAIDHFSVYLKDTRFEVITDHRPIEKLSVVHKKTLDRLHELMNQHECTIRYRPGSLNQVADALSRNAVDAFVTDEEASAFSAALGKNVNIQDMQAQDPLCRAILANLTGTPVDPTLQEVKKSAVPYSPYCSIHEGVLVIFQHTKAHSTRPLIVLPERFKRDVIKQAHCHRFAGHQSAYKTTFRILERFWWPTLSMDVKEYCSACISCQMAQNPHKFHTTLAPVKPLPVPDAPNHRVHADLFGPLIESQNGNRWVLVITDAFSKYTNLVALPDKNAKTVAQAIFDNWICLFSPMRQLLTDNGREFANNISKELCQLMDIKRTFTSSIHPQTNASAESFNKWIIHYFKRYPLDSDKQWEQYLGPLKITYNTSIHDATNHSPFFLTFARQHNSLLFNWDTPEFEPESYPQEIAMRMKLTFKQVAEHIETARRNMIKWQRSAKMQHFLPNQNVLVYYPKETFTGKGRNAKFVPNWQAGTIVEKLTDVTYRAKLNKTQRQFAVHINRLKPLHTGQFDENAPLSDPTTRAGLDRTYNEQRMKHWPFISKRAEPAPKPAIQPPQTPTAAAPAPPMQPQQHKPDKETLPHAAPAPPQKKRGRPKKQKTKTPQPIDQSSPAANTRSKARSQPAVSAVSQTTTPHRSYADVCKTSPQKQLGRSQATDAGHCLYESFHNSSAPCVLCKRKKGQETLLKTNKNKYKVATPKQTWQAHLLIERADRQQPIMEHQQSPDQSEDWETASGSSTDQSQADAGFPPLQQQLSQSDQERSPPESHDQAQVHPHRPSKPPPAQTLDSTPPPVSHKHLTRSQVRDRIRNFHNPSRNLTPSFQDAPASPSFHGYSSHEDSDSAADSPAYNTRLSAHKATSPSPPAHPSEEPQALQQPPKTQATPPPAQLPAAIPPAQPSPDQPQSQKPQLPLALQRLLPFNISPELSEQDSSSSTSSQSPTETTPSNNPSKP